MKSLEKDSVQRSLPQASTGTIEPITNSRDGQTHTHSYSPSIETTYLLCNHGLQGLYSQKQETSGALPQHHIGAWTNDLSCGECNILGRFSTGGNHYHSVTGCDFSDNSVEPNEVSASILDSSLSSYNKGLSTIDVKKCKHHLTNSVHFTSQNTFGCYTPLCSFTPHDTNWIVIRSFHTGSRLLEESKSKAEETVKALIDEAKEKLSEKEEKSKKRLEKTVVQALKPTPKRDPLLSPPEVEKPKLTIRQKIVHELKHYYNGFRLLWIDIKVCCRHLWSVLNGKTLTRRERRQVFIRFFLILLLFGSNFNVLLSPSLHMSHFMFVCMLNCRIVRNRCSP